MVTAGDKTFSMSREPGPAGVWFISFPGGSSPSLDDKSRNSVEVFQVSVNDAVAR